VLLTGTEYTDLMITDLRAPRVTGQGGAVSFALELQEVIQAKPTTSRNSEQRDEAALQKQKTAGTGGTRRPTKNDIAKAKLSGPLSQWFP